MNLVITSPAAKKVSELLIKNSTEGGMRVYVEGGGCSGMKYGFAFENQANEDDFVFEKDGINFYVDGISAQYLDGAEIDYVEDLMSASFHISNPNSTTTCGCGSSFAAG